MNAPDILDIIEAATPAQRHSRQARVAWGDHVVTVGGNVDGNVHLDAARCVPESSGNSLRIVPKRPLLQLGQTHKVLLYRAQESSRGFRRSSLG